MNAAKKSWARLAQDSVPPETLLAAASLADGPLAMIGKSMRLKLFSRLKTVEARVRSELATVVGARGSLVTARDWPLPPGWSEEELRGVWSSFSIDGSPPGMLDPYFTESYGRVLLTWELVRGRSGNALELGSNPFFTTWMLQQFTDLTLSQANFFGQRGEATQELAWTDRDGTLRRSPMSMQLFNMEEDTFPYADASFDIVACCEVIEHLLMDPLRSLREIHRVLAPGGTLVLTTPNAGRLENVIALVQGRNIYDPYSGFGPYGRHNREFIPRELFRLLDFAGFSLQRISTSDSHRWDRTPTAVVEASLAPMLAGRSPDLGQYIFCEAIADHEPHAGWPDTFYRSRPAEELVPWL